MVHLAAHLGCTFHRRGERGVRSWSGGLTRATRNAYTISTRTKVLLRTSVHAHYTACVHRPSQRACCHRVTAVHGLMADELVADWVVSDIPQSRTKMGRPQEHACCTGLTAYSPAAPYRSRWTAPRGRHLRGTAPHFGPARGKCLIYLIRTGCNGSSQLIPRNLPASCRRLGDLRDRTGEVVPGTFKERKRQKQVERNGGLTMATHTRPNVRTNGSTYMSRTYICRLQQEALLTCSSP